MQGTRRATCQNFVHGGFSSTWMREKRSTWVLLSSRREKRPCTNFWPQVASIVGYGRVRLWSSPVLVFLQVRKAKKVSRWFFCSHQLEKHDQSPTRRPTCGQRPERNTIEKNVPLFHAVKGGDGWRIVHYMGANSGSRCSSPTKREQRGQDFFIFFPGAK